MPKFANEVIVLAVLGLVVVALGVTTILSLAKGVSSS